MPTASNRKESAVTNSEQQKESVEARSVAVEPSPKPSEERPQVRVTDKRGGSTLDASTDDTTETAPARSAEAEARVQAINDAINATEVADPVDVLLGKTFQFIISQPEFPAMLNLPKPVRKKLGQDFGKMLSRFPHFSKVLDNGE